MIKSLKVFFAVFILIVKAQAQNYDEAKVPAYTLPDVLKTNDGKVVKDKTDWEKKRRPEVLTLFEDNVYGQMPKTFDNLTF